MKLDDFKARVNKMGGMARNNLYELDVSFPGTAKMSSLGTNEVRETLNVFGKAAALPAATMSTIEFYHGGKAFKIPGDRQYEPWTCTFFVDARFETKNAIVDWIEQNKSFESRVHLNPYDSSAVNSCKDMLFPSLIDKENQFMGLKCIRHILLVFKVGIWIMVRMIVLWKLLVSLIINTGLSLTALKILLVFNPH